MSFLCLSLNASAQNAKLNINAVYERFSSSNGKSKNFGQSLALHQKMIYVGSPGEDVIYSCPTGGSSCDRKTGFDLQQNTTDYVMLGVAMSTSKSKIYTCAPRTNFQKYLQDDAGVGNSPI